MKRSNQWQKEIEKLQRLLKQTQLEETLKWNLPCYTYKDRNIAIIQPFKACLALMFFKGVLLKDPKGILVANGPNSQAARRIEFRSAQEITKLAPIAKTYIKEAIALEEGGEKVEFKKKTQKMPDELKKMFAENSSLKEAFDALTPGRQRGYLLHFSGAKQSSTRQSRIEACIPRIFKGKGLMDR